MNKKEFGNIFEKLAYNYKNWKVDTQNKKEVEFWYNEFKDFKTSEFEQMVNDYIREEDYPPVVSKLRSKYRGYR